MPEDEHCFGQFQRPCEYCHEPCRPADRSTFSCGVCKRQYHADCLTQCHQIPDTAAGATYTCNECTTGYSSQYKQGVPTTISTLHPDLRLYNVQWQPRCETLGRVADVGTADAQAQLAQRLRRAQQERPPHPPAAHPQHPDRPNAPVRHHYPTGQLYDITIGQPKRKQLVIHPMPINPHADIHPTGQRALTIRRIPTPQASQSDLSNPDSWPERACIHHADGRCTHVLAVDTTAQLYARYLHVKEHHPNLFHKLDGGSFEEELYRLLMRYTPGNVIDGTKISTRAQQALPAPLHNMLHTLIGSTTERLASPLNVAGPTSAYWSLHERDRLFGANWNAYSVQWTGASVAVPDHTDSTAAVQAIKWAHQSAIHTSVPTLTLLVLPAYGSSGTEGGYMRWLQQHPCHCRHLLCLPKSSINWQLPANSLHEKKSRGKYNVNVIAVGNETGFTTHLPFWTPGWRERLQGSLRDALKQNQAAKKRKILQVHSQCRCNVVGTAPAIPAARSAMTNCPALLENYQVISVFPKGLQVCPL